MSDKSPTSELAKKYGLPLLVFIGGAAFDRYLLPRIEEGLKKRTDRKFYDLAQELLVDLKEYAKDKPQFSEMDEFLDSLEKYLAERRQKEQDR